MPEGNRSFLVGETIHLSLKVSNPGTPTPVDPAVVELTWLRTGGVDIPLFEQTFTRERTGQYSYVLATDLLTAGSYTFLATISDGPGKVSMWTDSFVLLAP